MTSRRHTSRPNGGGWLPEHVRIAILHALAGQSSEQAKKDALETIRRKLPALPMNNDELRDAVDRLAAEQHASATRI